MGKSLHPLIALGIAAACITTAGYRRISTEASTAPTLPAKHPGSLAEAVSVTWVFGPEELLSCDPPSRILRGLKEKYRGRLRVTAIFVGDDPSLAAQFLKSERIPMQVVAITGEDFRRRFGTRERPFILAEKATEQVVLSKQAWAASQADGSTELEQIVARFTTAPVRTLGSVAGRH